MKTKLILNLLFLVLFSFSVTAGESVEIGHSSDMLELRETIGDVRENLTESDLPNLLAGGSITNSLGSTEYNQYLKFVDYHYYGYSKYNSYLTTDFVEKSGPYGGFVKDYLILDVDENQQYNEWNNESLFIYELEFNNGLTSRLYNSSFNPYDYSLEDIYDMNVNILGEEYFILNTNLQHSYWSGFEYLELYLMNSEESYTFNQYENRTINFNGYEVNISVFNIELQNGEPVVYLSIDSDEFGGFSLRASGEGDFLLEFPRWDSGLAVGRINIDPQNGDTVDLHFGADAINFQFNLDGSDYWRGDVEIYYCEDEYRCDLERVNSESHLDYRNTSTEFTIESIKYMALPSKYSENLQIDSQQGVRNSFQHGESQAAFLTDNWDIFYDGFVEVNESIIKLDPKGDDDYNLIFENRLGQVYNVPFITNEGGVFKYGNDDRDFVFIEGFLSPSGNGSTHIPTVGFLDYFVLNNVESQYNPNNFNNSITHILRYEGYEEDNHSNTTLQFEDMATGTLILVDFNSTNSSNGTMGYGEIVLDGNIFSFYVANVSQGIPPLIIDMDGNGDLSESQWSNEVFAVTLGGSLMDFGNHLESKGGLFYVNHYYGVTWNNTGNRINGNNVMLNITTPSNYFDEGGPTTVQWGHEMTIINIVNRSGNEIGIDLTSLQSNGGIGSLIRDSTNYSNLYGMTDFGALWTVYDPSLTDNPETLTIEYPSSQRGVRVYVVEDINDFIDDVQAPDVTILSPVDSIEYNTTTINFDMLAFDNVAIDSRWYDYNGTNVTFNGAIDLVYPVQGTYQITAYANDTSGNIGMETVTFNIVFSDLPDLYIDNVIYTPTNPEVGDEITINLSLANGGTVPVSGFDWVYDWNHGVGINSFTLNSGESLNLSFKHTYTLGGDYTFYFEVDPTDNITELNENNNVLLLDLFVDGTPELEPKLISKKKDPNNRNNVVYKYRIKNTGNVYVENLDYSMTFGDGSGNGGFIGERINPGSFYLLTLEHEYLTAGLYESSLAVDTFNFFDESNETNNEVSTSVWVPCDKSNGVMGRCLAKKR